MSAYFRSRTTSDAVTTNVILDNGGLKLPIYSPGVDDNAYDGSLRFNSAENVIELSNDGTWTDTALLSMAKAAETFATLEYLNTRIAEIINSSPASLDTLKELATALGNDANYAATTATALGNRLRVDTSTQNLTSSQKTNARTNLGLATVAATGSYADLTGKPTNLSAFTNDSGYVTGSGVRTQLSAGAGVAYNSSTGVISIGQPVGITDSVAFNTVTANEFISTGTGTPTFRSATNIVLAAAGEVIVDSAMSLKQYSSADLDELVVPPGTVAYDSTIGQLRVWDGSTWSQNTPVFSGDYNDLTNRPVPNYTQADVDSTSMPYGTALPATIVSGTITTTGGAVRLHISGNCIVNTGGNPVIQFQRGTSGIGRNMTLTNNGLDLPFASEWIDIVPSGTYMYSVKVVSGSIGNGTTFNDSVLTIIELK